MISEAEDAALPPTRLDGEDEHKRDAKPHGQPDRHRNQLQGDLETGQVRRGATGGLLRREMQQAATPEAGWQLK